MALTKQETEALEKAKSFASAAASAAAEANDYASEALEIVRQLKLEGVINGAEALSAIEQQLTFPIVNETRITTLQQYINTVGTGGDPNAVTAKQLHDTLESLYTDMTTGE